MTAQRRTKITLYVIALWIVIWGALLLASHARAQVVAFPPPGGAVALVCANNTSPPTPVAGMFYFVQCDSSGKLITNASGGGGGGTSSTFGAAFPTTGTAIGLSNGTNMVALLEGTQSIANSLSVTPATSSVWASSAAFGSYVDGSMVTIGSTSDTACATYNGTCSLEALIKFLNNAATSALPAGTHNIGSIDILGNAGGILDTAAGTPASTLFTVQGSGSGTPIPVSSATLATAANQVLPYSQTSTTAGQTGPLMQGAVTTSAPTYVTAETSPLSLETNGYLRVDASAQTLQTTIKANTLGGGGVYSAVGGTGNALLTGSLVTVKASQGTFLGAACYNPDSAVTYIQILNTTAGTLGTTVPLLVLSMGATSQYTLTTPPAGIVFNTGIQVAATTTTTGSTAPTTAVPCAIFFD